MFDLERAITDWRQHMTEGGVASAEVLDELESHLREDVEEQVRSGTDVARAFDSAVRRIGTAAMLRNEFAKCGRPKRALRQQFLRSFFFVSATMAILIDVYTLIAFELSPLERGAGAFAVAGVTLYLFRLPFLPLWRQGVRRARMAEMMKAAGVIVPVWAFWALLRCLRPTRSPATSRNGR